MGDEYTTRAPRDDGPVRCRKGRGRRYNRAMRPSPWIVASAFAALLVPLVGQQHDRACNTDNIDWVLPGHFQEAVSRGKSEQRLILIKGVSFGIDVAGARCATKGKW